jgi:hypothetical protein
MSILDKRLAVLAIPVALGLGIAGATAGGSDTATGPIQCGIESKSNNGMIAFRGVLQADTDLSGSYAFRIASAGHGGSANISQNGNLSAGAGEEIHLGQAALSDGGRYDVEFEVTANGTTYDCSEPVPTRT